MVPSLARVPLSRLAVDRDAVARGRAALFDELLADPATRVLPVWRGSALADAGGAHALSLLRVEAVTSALVRVYLGRTVGGDRVPVGTPVIAVGLSDGAARELEPDSGRWLNLREAAVQLDDLDVALFTEALAILNWHETSGHCPRCGIPTVVMQGGWVRHCVDCDSEDFPRTDAAVIVAVVDDEERLLLGSNAVWEQNRWSLLAGFVEPGESFESAVRREVAEEVGVQLGDVDYVGSQPWPFPASVMVGFRARPATGAADVLQPDGEEIVAARWFSREELWRNRDHVLLPGTSSIAHAMIEQWYDGPLDAPPAGLRGSA